MNRITPHLVLHRFTETRFLLTGSLTTIRKGLNRDLYRIPFARFNSLPPCNFHKIAKNITKNQNYIQKSKQSLRNAVHEPLGQLDLFSLVG